MLFLLSFFFPHCSAQTAGERTPSFHGLHAQVKEPGQLPFLPRSHSPGGGGLSGWGGEVDPYQSTPLLIYCGAPSTGVHSLSPPDEGGVTILVTAPSAGLPEGRRGGGQVNGCWEVLWAAKLTVLAGASVLRLTLCSTSACLSPLSIF